MALGFLDADSDVGDGGKALSDVVDVAIRPGVPIVAGVGHDFAQGTDEGPQAQLGAVELVHCAEDVVARVLLPVLGHLPKLVDVAAKCGVRHDIAL